MQYTRHPAERYVRFDFTGDSDLPVLKAHLRVIGADAGVREKKAVMLDLLQVQGDLTTTERYDLGVAAAEVFKGVDKVAVVQQVVQNRGFAALVANNRGARIRIFTEAAQAVEWLTA